jgi:hypothetical protein
MESRAALLEPIVDLIEDWGYAPEASFAEIPKEPGEARPKHPAASRKPSSEGVTLGAVGDDTTELGFDPFKAPEEQTPPGKEPDAVVMRKQMLGMLEEAISALPEHGPGQVVRFLMPIDWNANDAADLFKANGRYSLAPGREGSHGVRLVQNGRDSAGNLIPAGWEVSAVRNV